MVVLSDTGDPAALRRLIEWFIAQDLEGAALFMTDRVRGFEHAQQARLIAEMLGV
jgi:N-acetylglutamate synthase/N-acetylornithine aminotransferase